MMPSVGDLAQIFSRDHSSMGGDTTRRPRGGAAAPSSFATVEPAFGGSNNVGGNHRGGDGYYYDDPGLSVGYDPADSSSTTVLQRQPSSQPPPPSFSVVRHSWDSDSQFPIQEIERIKRKTHRLRSQRKQQQQQQQQQELEASSQEGQEVPDWAVAPPLQPQHSSSDSGSPSYPSPPALVRHGLGDFDELDDKVRAFEHAQQRHEAARPPPPPRHHHRGRSNPPPVPHPHDETETDTGTDTGTGTGTGTGTDNSEGRWQHQPHRPHHAWSDDVSSKTNTPTDDDSYRRTPTPTPPPPPSSFTSRAAQVATHTLLRGFHQTRSTRALQAPAPRRPLPPPSGKPPPSSASSAYPQPPGPSSSSARLLDTSDPTTAEESHDTSYSATTPEGNDHDTDTERRLPHHRLSGSGSDDASDPHNHHTGDVDDNWQLHDLCGEAVSTDDVAWRNALHLLSIQPTLARLPDDDGQGWTPLHICCLSVFPPPEYLIRALLYAWPNAAKTPDAGGRLPLHLVAASSAHVKTMRLLVQQHPAALYHTDAHGFVPLHLLLRNLRVSLTTDRARVLLGLDDVTHSTTHGPERGMLPASSAPSSSSSRSLLQRRRQHWHLTLEQLESYRQAQQTYPVTTIRKSGQRERNLDHEAHFDTAAHPPDIRTALQRLRQGKRQQQSRSRRATKRPSKGQLEDTTTDDDEDDDDEEHPAIEVELPNSMLGSTINPAALSAPNSLHLPLHTLVYRSIVDKKVLEREPKSKSPTLPPSPVVDQDDDPEQATSSSSSSTSSEDDDRPRQLSVEHPLDLLRLFVACHPLALVTRDADGMTPLLIALVKGDDPSAVGPSLDEIQLLLGQDPQWPDWALDLPPSPEHSHPARMATRETRQLPLHLVAEELREWEVVRAVHEAYPGAVHEPDHLGRTPLHVALGSYRRLPVDPEILGLLFSDRVAQMRDLHGRLPLDLLLDHPYSLPSKRPQSNVHLSRASVSTFDDSSSILVYQRFIHASLSGAAKPRCRDDATELLRRLQRLPPWLREQACASPLVQNLLVEDVAHPTKCFFVLLEGVLLVALITVFRLQMEQFVAANDANVELSTWYTYAVYGTATLWLTLEVSRWLVAANLGEFRHLVLFHLVSWINGIALFMAITTSVLLYTTRDESQLYALGTAATGFLWISLMGYLSNWSYGVSVFFGGLSKVR